MARATPNLESFAGGETSSLFQARVRHAKYYVSTRDQRNMVSLPQGPVTRRPGVMHINEAKVSTDPGRILPFVFSDVQAYIKELGDRYFRFFKDKARIVAPTTTAVITNGTFPTDIAGWTDESDVGSSIAHDATNQRMDLISAGADFAWAEQSVAGTIGVKTVLKLHVFGAAGNEVLVRVGTATKLDDTVAEIGKAVGTHLISFTPTTSPFFVQFRHKTNKTLQIDDISIISNAPIELDSPYAKADLFKLKYTQSTDTFYITAKAYAWRKLTRRDHDDWSLVEIATIDGPYFDENTDSAKTLQPSATSGLGITVTAVGHAPFSGTDVGRLVRIKHSATYGFVRITGFTSSTVVIADVINNFAAATAQAEWALGLYSDTTGHPAAVMFHEERLVLAGSTDKPGRFDASKNGDFENFTPGTADDDPLAVNIAANQVPNIRWLHSGKALLIGTDSGEARVGAANLTSPLTPANSETKFQTRHGSDDQSPVAVAEVVLFVQKHGRKLRELVFKFEKDGFVAPDLTVLAEHISRSRIIELAWQQQPWSIVWAARTDGKLVGMTYQRDEDVIAWHPHPLGGGGKVRSIATIPGADADELWLLNEYTINGVVKKYIELLSDPLDEEDDGDDAVYMDSALTLDAPLTISGVTLTDPVKVTVTGHTFADGDRIRIKNVAGTVELNKKNFKVTNKTANDFDLADDDDANIDGTGFTAYLSGGQARLRVTTITNAGHLEGVTVKILGDGAVQTDQKVVGGSITLEAPASIVHIGHGQTWALKPQRLEDPSGATKVGKTQRIIKAYIDFLRSGTVKIGRDAQTAKVIEFRTQADAMDQPVPLFTGFKKVDFKGNYDREGTVLLTGDDPSPVTIRSIIPDVNWSGH